MCTRWRIGALSLLILATPALPARAGAEPEHIRIQFAAAKGCPAAAAFLQALRQRTERFQLAGQTEMTRAFVVTITQTGTALSGRLEINGPGSEVSVRNVTGKTCDEVLAALAFMAALAIDPSAAPSPTSPSPTSPAGSGSPTPAPATPAGTTARTRVPSSEAPPMRSSSGTTASRPPSTPPAIERGMDTRPEEPERPALVAAGPAAPQWHWLAGAQGDAGVRFSPNTGWGGQLFVEAAAPGVAVWVPAVRAGLFLHRSATSLASGAQAEFQWAAAFVEGCPLRFTAIAGRVTFHPCLAFHLGVLRGRGEALDRPEQTTDLWAAVGPVGRLRIAVAWGFFLETQGILVLPLRRLAFEVYDAGPGHAATPVFTVPRVGVLAGIGLAYQFR